MAELDVGQGGGTLRKQQDAQDERSQPSRSDNPAALAGMGCGPWLHRDGRPIARSNHARETWMYRTMAQRRLDLGAGRAPRPPAPEGPGRPEREAP
jgi:hypothetical protein